MAKLKQSRSWIPDAQSVRLTFSKIATFYFTKIENSIKQFLTALILLLTSAKLRSFGTRW